MSILSEALRYQRLGLSVIPIEFGTKKPAVKGWKPYMDAIAPASIIKGWHSANRLKAIAIICGRVSGELICRDFDKLEAYEAWAGAHPTWAEQLPTVATHRGRHIYCRGDVEAVRSIAKGGGLCAVLADGELRAGGCYVVAPPSPHPEGSTYRWQIPIEGDIPRVDLRAVGLIPCNGEARAGGEHVAPREGRENRGVQKTLLVVTTSEPQPSPPSSAAPSSCLLCSLDSLPSLLQETIREAIVRTVPTSPGKRHSQLFEFARVLKSIPELADQPAKALKPLVAEWFKQAKAVSQTTWEENWFDFCEAWDKVKYPKGQEPIAVLFRQAEAAEPPAIAAEYEDPKIRLLVAWCRELQRYHGEMPFPLACRIAGAYLDVDHSTVSRWLRGLCHDEVLREVSKGSQKSHKASRFRYLGDGL